MRSLEEIMDRIRQDAFPFLIGFMVVVILLTYIIAAFAATPLEVAKAEIGRGETIANNKGADIARYRADGVPWCAAFVSYCLKEAGYDLPYLLRAKSFLKYGKRIETPKPGDLVVFWRGTPGAATGHVGIVEAVTDEEIIVIEGNRGDFPAKVERVVYNRRNIPRLLAFVRI
jgi:uncharacterized protein (TIGR02594 family)